MLTRRHAIRSLAATAAAGGSMASTRTSWATTAVLTGAFGLVESNFAAIAGKRIGLIANHTSRVEGTHLADLMAASGKVKLTAILAPEHGFRGLAEAGAKVADGRDARTGVPVYSLYGRTRRPTPEMLRDVDCLVFDIQDVGARFYTYISTMGLAMQAAAAARIPFVVLDRPNPLGGTDVSGYVIEPALKSFVGQYPIPIVHGMTVGELARMIKAERWLSGLADLDLAVIALRNWTRAMRWPATGLPWIATSPNIPTFLSALVYPGMGIVGETLVNEGRGTPIPFQQCGAPWLDATATVARLNQSGLPGAAFAATIYTPRPIPNVAADPRFANQTIPGIKLVVTDADRCLPLETGIHILCALRDQASFAGVPLLDGRDMFAKIAGTARLQAMLAAGGTAGQIIAQWQTDAASFRARRQPHLVY